MADSMANHKSKKSVQHMLQRCDEVRDQFLNSRVTRQWWDETQEPHLIEIRTEDVTNDHIVQSEADKVSDLQRYDIIKFLERQTGEVIEAKTVFFNVGRKQKDMLLEKVLHPKLVRRHGEDDTHALKKRFKAVVSE